MDDEKYLHHFQLIAEAGQSKSNSLEAIKAARDGNYEEAKQLLEEAEKDLKGAHGLHFDMLQEEANGNRVEVNIVAIHAQDHLTMATVLHDIAFDIINLYQKVEKYESFTHL